MFVKVADDFFQFEVRMLRHEVGIYLQGIVKILLRVDSKTDVIASLDEVWTVDPFAAIVLRMRIDVNGDMLVGLTIVGGGGYLFECVKRHKLAPEAKMRLDRKSVV